MRGPDPRRTDTHRRPVRAPGHPVTAAHRSHAGGPDHRTGDAHTCYARAPGRENTATHVESARRPGHRSDDTHSTPVRAPSHRKLRAHVKIARARAAPPAPTIADSPGPGAANGRTAPICVPPAGSGPQCSEPPITRCARPGHPTSDALNVTAGPGHSSSGRHHTTARSRPERASRLMHISRGRARGDATPMPDSPGLAPAVLPATMAYPSRVRARSAPATIALQPGPGQVSSGAHDTPAGSGHCRTAAQNSSAGSGQGHKATHVQTAGPAPSGQNPTATHQDFAGRRP